MLQKFQFSPKAKMMARAKDTGTGLKEGHIPQYS